VLIRTTRRLLAACTAGLALTLLALPVGHRVETGVIGARFLGEFLTGGRQPWLSATTETPARTPISLSAGGHADLWRTAAGGPHRGLVLVHGMTPTGKDDSRLAAAAGLLARSGFAVIVPDLPALRAQRLEPKDGVVVAAALRRLLAEPGVATGGVVVIAVSVGVGPAAVALADPTLAGSVQLVASLGGYADARELVRYFTTGTYRFGTTSGHVEHDPALAREFVALNLDLVRDATDREAVRAALTGGQLAPAAGPEARAVLAVLMNRDPARVDALLGALPAETQALLDTLSPVRVVRRWPGRLLAVHGRGDPAVPFTESLRLAAAAAPGRGRHVLVDVVDHVEGSLPALGQIADAVRLWSAVYEILRNRAR
jgi:pimeloyl-ACP methyl ester carboxylesterase